MEVEGIGPDEARRIVSELADRYPDPTGQLLNVLNDIQEQYRYLPSELLDAVAERFAVSRQVLDSMGDFFHYLSLDPVGRCEVEVCDGTACHLQGSSRLIHEFERLLGIRVGETSANGDVTLKSVACVGACGLAPLVVVDGQSYGRIKISQVPTLGQMAQERARAKAVRDG